MLGVSEIGREQRGCDMLVPPRCISDPAIQCSSDDSGGGTRMKKVLAALTIAMTLAPWGASAQERTGDAALGALAGAVAIGVLIGIMGRRS